MVEQWSSKSPTRVRILLSLIIFKQSVTTSPVHTSAVLTSHIPSLQYMFTISHQYFVFFYFKNYYHFSTHYFFNLILWKFVWFNTFKNFLYTKNFLNIKFIPNTIFTSVIKFNTIHNKMDLNFFVPQQNLNIWNFIYKKNYHPYLWLPNLLNFFFKTRTIKIIRKSKMLSANFIIYKNFSSLLRYVNLSKAIFKTYIKFYKHIQTQSPDVFFFKNEEFFTYTHFSIYRRMISYGKNIIFKLPNFKGWQIWMKTSSLISSNIIKKPYFLNSYVIEDEEQKKKSLLYFSPSTLLKSNIYFFFKFRTQLTYTIFANNLLLKIFLYSNTKFFHFDYLNSFFKKFYFYHNLTATVWTNINPNLAFKYTITKMSHKIASAQKFNPMVLPFYTHMLTRFVEAFTGKKSAINLFFFINYQLTVEELTRCIMWTQKLKTFQRTVGHGFFLSESIQVLYLALKLKDPYFLINWMSNVLNKISFWKIRMLFHFLRYTFKYFFWEVFKILHVRGIKFKLKGKISVAGNARTRTLIYKIGDTSFATLDNKILHSFELIRTFTGVMGLQIWIVF